MELEPTPSSSPGPIPDPPPQGSGGKIKKAAGPLAVLVALLAKLKGAAVLALKFLPFILKTGGTMLVSVWAYAMLWGWRYAVGFVLLIFVHECGHLLVAKKLGLKVGAPMFIPFVGALIALKEMPRNAWIEAQVGIGGPLLGTVGAAICNVIYAATKNPLFGALAYTGFLLNLFNLAPLGFLDGGRIVTALSPWLWLIGALVIGGMMFIHFNILLLIIFVLSLPRLFSLFRKRTSEEARYYEVTPQHRLIMGTMYFGLMAMLATGMAVTRVQTDTGHAANGQTISYNSAVAGKNELTAGTLMAFRAPR